MVRKNQDNNEHVSLPPPLIDQPDVEMSDVDEVMVVDKNNPLKGGQLDQSFKCKNCAAMMVFKPGSQSQKCPYCGHKNKIALTDSDIKELDFKAYLAKSEVDESLYETHQSLQCPECAAETIIDEKEASCECPFCGTNIVTTAKSLRQIKPKALLPFAVTRKVAWRSFGQWIDGLWFAPNDLKRIASREDKLSGIYVPYWTYDCDTTSVYHGFRGDHYYVTKSYTTTVNGKSVRRTRRVRKTRWWPASGTVFGMFDDILILASDSLPRENTEKLEPWDLENLVDYQSEYLSGFKAEHYKVNLPEGFSFAIDIMDQRIRKKVCQDIGGDVQRITSVRTAHEDVTFKHILLPIWLSAYRYKSTVYRFMINARTGEVQGERPYSWLKIAAATLSGLIILGGIAIALGQ